MCVNLKKKTWLQQNTNYTMATRHWTKTERFRGSTSWKWTYRWTQQTMKGGTLKQAVLALFKTEITEQPKRNYAICLSLSVFHALLGKLCMQSLVSSFQDTAKVQQASGALLMLLLPACIFWVPGRGQCLLAEKNHVDLHRPGHPVVWGPESAVYTSLWTLGYVWRGELDSLSERWVPYPAINPLAIWSLGPVDPQKTSWCG